MSVDQISPCLTGFSFFGCACDCREQVISTRRVVRSLLPEWGSLRHITPHDHAWLPMSNAPRTAAQTIARNHFFRGSELLKRRHDADALAEFCSAVEADPNFAEAHLNIGFLLERAAKWSDAAVAYERAAALNPRLLEAHLNLGNVQLKLGAWSAAASSFGRAIDLRPDSFEARINLCTALRLQNELTAALEAGQAALALRPENADAWTNLANIYRAQNRIEEALKAARRAIAIAPDSAPAHLNLAMACLVSGDLRTGWPHAEYRHVLKVAGAGRVFSQPAWTGAESLEGRTILLHGEQGFGDSLQFLRYVPLVAERGARVWVEIQPPLKALVAASFPGVAPVVAHGEPLPDFDVHCSLASLPLAFNTSLGTIPRSIPYVRTPPDRTARWKGFLNADGRLRVGIAWCGNPTHPNDHNRSVPLAALESWFSGHVQIQFFSLKKEMPAADVAVLAGLPQVRDLGPHLGDFADTAALIEQLDLVIGVDTSVVHLAGALGKPVWVMLPFSPDWRWLLDREDSPWYPTARLFRQPRTGDWSSVIARVCAELGRFRS